MRRYYRVQLTYTRELGLGPRKLTLTIHADSDAQALRSVIDVYEEHVERLLGVEIISSEEN